MTAQIQDEFRYQGTVYEIAGISEGDLFDVHTLGLEPKMASTACFRGYQAVFALQDNRLVLHTLYANLIEDMKDFERTEGPVIHGVRPTGPEERNKQFNNHYEGVKVPLSYSGGILLCNDFIEELYEHMGFHPAWKYRDVVELVFEEGRVVAEEDRSARMADVRTQFEESSRNHEYPTYSPGTKIEDYVARAFDRRY